MKIILQTQLIQDLFDTDDPNSISVEELLNHTFIKSKFSDATVTGVYRDTMDANNLNNWVITLVPKGLD